MPIQRLLSVALFIGGIVLLVMGIRETDSFGSQVSKFFTGSFTDRAIWLMLGGVAAIVAGASMSMMPARNAL